MRKYKDLPKFADYYAKVLVPYNKKYRYTRGTKFLCPFHDDKNPSLGVYVQKGKQMYHCFGCGDGKSGDIIDFHKRVQLEVFNKSINHEEAYLELCKLFDITPEEDKPQTKEEIRNEQIEKRLERRRALKSIDVSYYNDKIREGKELGKGIKYYNDLLACMLVEENRKRSL